MITVTWSISEVRFLPGKMKIPVVQKPGEKGTIISKGTGISTGKIDRQILALAESERQKQKHRKIKSQSTKNIQVLKTEPNNTLYTLVKKDRL